MKYEIGTVIKTRSLNVTRIIISVEVVYGENIYVAELISGKAASIVRIPEYMLATYDIIKPALKDIEDD